jgi:hypothetical protein
MARPDLLLHPKFRRLAFVLQEPEPHCLGYLEMMWHVGYASGNPVLGDAVDVELSAKYPGTKGKLAAALLECGFLDRLDGDRFAIHDLYDHAPEYVKNRAKKEEERRKEKVCKGCGNLFHSADVRATHCSDHCRVRAHRQGQQDTRRNGSQRIDPLPKRIVTDCYTTPSPSPSPSPIEEASPNGEESATPTTGPSSVAQEFVDAWNAHPCFPACRKLTEARKRHLRARLADSSWVSSWREALARAAASPFCRGENDRGWRADVDWFLKPDTVTKILEGKYDDRAGQNGHTPGETAEQYAARLRLENADRDRREARRQQALAGANGEAVK